jgi:hypothetical protein
MIQPLGHPFSEGYARGLNALQTSGLGKWPAQMRKDFPGRSIRHPARIAGLKEHLKPMMRWLVAGVNTDNF